MSADAVVIAFPCPDDDSPTSSCFSFNRLDCCTCSAAKLVDALHGTKENPDDPPSTEVVATAEDVETTVLN